MTIKDSIVLLTMIILISCNTDKNTKSVYQVLNKDGQVIEEYGNHHTSDENTNFRYFFYYSNNRVVEEKCYFFDDSNTACIVKDTLDYTKICYKYDASGKLIVEEVFQPKYDSVKKVTVHYISYRKDYIVNKEESFGESK